MKKDYSPEEKLLRLIRSSGKKPLPREETPAPKIQPAEEPVPKLDAAAVSQSQIAPKPKRAKPGSLALPFKLKEVNTRIINTIFLVILAVLLLYFVYDLLYASFYEESEPRIFVEDEAAIHKTEKGAALDIKPYSYYSSSVEGRNIFMPQQVEIEPAATGPTVDEVRANLSLIGIIAGERPQAIIEDRKAGKSYFLYKGGSVGEAKVVDVLDDSVIMEYQGQKFELVL